MRIEHINQRIEQQYELRTSIKDFAQRLHDRAAETVPIAAIKTRRSFLKEQWQDFKRNHQAINVAINSLTDQEQDTLLGRRYFRNQLFRITQDLYVSALERANSLIDVNSTSLREASLSRFSSSTGEGHRVIHHAPRLPQLDFPKFNGSVLEWLPFRAVFEKMVVDNPAVDAVYKAHYLKAAMIGSAAHFLNSTTVTEENFKLAWEQLIDFYHNERVLLHHAMHSAAMMKKMSKESANDLEHLYSTVKQTRNTLVLLKRSMPGIDDFLIYSTTQRFDPETLKAWEHHLGDSKEPPIWDRLSSFIVSRLLTLKSYENSSNQKTSNSVSSVAKVHHVETRPSNNSSQFRPPPCILCSESHWFSRCPKYLSKTLQQRDEIVTKHNRCFNCLGSHHSNSCPSTRRCSKCGNKHHTTLHRNPSNSSRDVLPSVHAHHASRLQPHSILLATAKLLILTDQRNHSPIRALIDQGSEVSLISESIVQLLRLPRESASMPIIGIGGHSTSRTRGLVRLNVCSHSNESETLSLVAHILPKLTTSLPSSNPTIQMWPHLQGLTLADPDFCKPGSIDLILGADVYGQIIEDGIVKGTSSTPTGQRTRFGWIISGPSGGDSTRPMFRALYANIDHNLNESLEKFWILDEVPKGITSKLTHEEEECERHFQATHSRDDHGRYIVRLPFKSPPSQLGESRSKAVRMLYCLQRKFNNNPDFKRAYTEFIEEYKRLQHLIEVPPSDLKPEYVYYLPHHGVLKESSLTTKLRAVFNGSCITSSGKSLNDLLHCGPKLQINLFDVLLFFRQFLFVFSGDIEKFYRQIKIHPDDWKFQRILWIQENNIVEYELTTDTYGLASAAYLALRALFQLIQDEGHLYPLAIPALTRGRYVDDITGGADTIEEAQNQIEQINGLCMAGGFPIQKWHSNHPDILNKVPKDRRLESLSKPIDGNDTTYTLGMAWQSSADTFHFTIKPACELPVTKRKILSAIARIFDPLGLLSPVIIVAKIFVQELWSVNLGWDDELSQNLSDKWIEYVRQLQTLEKLSVPRWLQLSSQSTFEIHGFCDASQQAMSAAIYLRVLDKSVPTITLVCAKTKVAPLKRLTIPRLELCAAVLLVKLLNHVISSMKWTTTPLFCWTDSSITHTWITGSPSRWKEFIHNRVCFIQDNVPSAQWRFIPGKMNPADCATRGLTPAELIQHPLWWNGPSWLTQASDVWPNEIQADYSPENLEERPAAVNLIAQIPESVLHHLYERAFTLTRLIRSTITFDRAIAKFKGQPNTSLRANPISLTELEDARVYWVKYVQGVFFSQELQVLNKGDQLSKNNPLVKLTPWTDPSGILRVGGRLQNSSLNSESKHPVILPRRTHLSKLIILDAHHKTLHGGTQLTLAYIRNNYWILGGRAPVRSVILHCVRCTRFRQQRAQQLMAPLPTPRVTRSRAFLHTGVDYAGPFTVKTWRGKAAKSYKGYLALFVCFATSAVHLELVSDYTADAFIAAYKRLIARRGICSVLYSDCGTNFKGADQELKRLFTTATQESTQISNLLSHLGTQWKFNPPSAPHFGGKWEAGVKSVKHHLRRVIGEHILTFEEMTTLLTQIEATLNSRPLCALSEDPEDLEALTPGHFLIGEALNVLPEPSLEHLKTGRLSRWQFIRQALDSFWSHWSNSCLQRYQAISKWHQRTPNLKTGDMVLLIDERYPPAKWPLGRITHTHPGADGLIRTVTVRTQSSILDRPIVKVCLLPINEEVI